MIGLQAFGDADYRRLWFGAAFNQQGMAGEQVLFGLLAYQVTQSTAAVGVVLGIYFVPFFVFGMVSGAIADRIDRRRLLRGIEVAIALNLCTFSAILSAGPDLLWPIAAFALTGGALRALHQPVRVSYAYDIVGDQRIVAALGLLNIGSRTGQLVGALVAGTVMDRLGAPAALLAIAAGHGVAALLFLRLRSAGIGAVTEHAPLRQNLQEYVAELRRNRILLLLVAVTAAVEVFGLSFITALPELATARLAAGADGLGLLHAARAFGGIVAGLALALTGGMRERRGVVYLWVIIGLGGGLLSLSAESPLAVTLAAVFLVAGLAAASDVLTQSMMQVSVDNALRGRAMGVWVLAVGFGPLGHLEIGLLAEQTGVAGALFVNGLVLLALGGLLAVAAPRLRAI